jgi:diguanylate cyclase (GGDEF)-like protein
MASPQVSTTEAKTIDPVTGFPDRSSLMRRLEELLSRPGPCFSALLLIQVSNLQSMVDGFSDLIVDEVLKELSSRLRRCVETLPGSCLIARIGPNKFAVLLWEQAESSAGVKFATQIQKEVELPFEWKNHQISLAVRIGIRLGAESDALAEDVLWDADTALSHSQQQGKAQYTIFEPNMRERIIARLSLEAELRQAVGEDFMLHYQPKVSLRSRKLVGFEALARWNHPKRGLIAPDEFIPVAEQTGYIVPLGNWIIEEACCQMSIWQQSMPQAAPLIMSVNLSTQQLLQENLIEHVKSCLQRYGLAAEALHLEVTETSIMENTDQVLRTMERLRELKINLWIDDFGTGHSSLGYLHRFPFKTLKIDRSFIARMGQKDTLSIIRAIVTLSHTLGMEIVAEGIETHEQADQLEQLGCDYGQGYLFSKPVEVTEATRMIMASKFPLPNNVESKVVQLERCLSRLWIPETKSFCPAG